MDCNKFDVQCGQFRNRKNFIVQHSNSQMISRTSILNEEHTLIEYFLNYIVIMSQSIPHQLPVPLNLFNINALPNINFHFQKTHMLYGQAIIQNNFNINIKPWNHNIVLRGGTLTSLNKSNISRMQCDNINSLLDNNCNSSGTDNMNMVSSSDNMSNKCISKSKKRQAPDYDDYDLDSRKHAKPFLKNELPYNDDFEVLKNSTTFLQFSEPKSPIDIVKSKWSTKKLADPHIDHTSRVIPVHSVNGRKEFLNEKRCMSCLLIFDNEIERIDKNIAYIGQDIYTLEIKYSQCINFMESCEIYDQITRLKRDENTLKNKYASLCEARDEVHQLYVHTKKSSLRFTADLITQNELDANNKIRQIFNTYEDFYGV